MTTGGGHGHYPHNPDRPEEDERVIAGAEAAFSRVQAAVDATFA